MKETLQEMPLWHDYSISMGVRKHRARLADRGVLSFAGDAAPVAVATGVKSLNNRHTRREGRSTRAYHGCTIISK